MRVYLPATLPLVVRLLSTGTLPGPVAGVAVTAEFRAWADRDGPSDDEELELAALAEAARGSLRLLAGDRASDRRVVLACDIPDASVRVEDGSETAWPGQVRVTSDVLAGWVKAAHVDDAVAAADVRRATGVVAAADADDADAEAVVAGLDAHDLLWYAPEELPDLVR
jgi:hypothetical protein